MFSQKHIQLWTLLSQAKSDAAEWSIVEDNKEKQTHREGNYATNNSNRIWKKPGDGWIKCNLDGSFSTSTRIGKAGWVVRDYQGVFRGAGQAVREVVNNTFEAECQALIISMQHCWSRGYRKMLFESDCKKLINILDGQSLNFQAYNWIREIRWWSRQFEAIRIIWIRRGRNKVADKLAKDMIPYGNLFHFHFYSPVTITNLLHRDYVSSLSS